MKRTVSVNISGQFFHIDEDAYEKLNRYLDIIRGYFSQEDGRDEIMADIEARISEMLREKVSDKKQVINAGDVDAVIAIMGRPEDYVEGAVPPGEQQQTYQQERIRRIYRNPDDKVLGGVCGGLGAYFNVDPLWIRLALVIMLFLFGFGPILYLILWIIIPEAKTPSEKLAMRGEPINIDNISKTFRSEVEGVGERIKKEARNFGKKDQAGKVRDGVRDFFTFISSLAGLFITAIVKILGVVFAIVAVSLLFILGSLIFTDQFYVNVNEFGGFFSLQEALGFIIADHSMALPLLQAGAILVLLVPAIALIMATIRILFNVRIHTNIPAIILGVFWLAGFLMIAWSAAFTAKEFTIKEVVTSGYRIDTASDTLYLQTNMFPAVNWDKLIADEEEDFFFAITPDSLFFPDVRIRITRSADTTFRLEQHLSARGTTRDEAIENAAQVSYKINSIDSLISLQHGLYMSRDDKYRAQQVRLVLFVPPGKAVRFSEEIAGMLHSTGNTQHIRRRQMGGIVWTMTENGLTCIDCQGEDQHPAAADSARNHPF